MFAWNEWEFNVGIILVTILWPASKLDCFVNVIIFSRSTVCRLARRSCACCTRTTWCTSAGARGTASANASSSSGTTDGTAPPSRTRPSLDPFYRSVSLAYEFHLFEHELTKDRTFERSSFRKVELLSRLYLTCLSNDAAFPWQLRIVENSVVL